jgi:hypothetical protein
MRRVFLFLILFLVGFAVYKILVANNIIEKNDYLFVKLGSKHFSLEVANTKEKMLKGLAGRDNMPADRGMIFLFVQPGHYGMIMNGMQFPLDFIWLNGKKVVGILHNVDINKCLEPYPCYPPQPVDAVIELNAGMAKNAGIEVGDTIEF